VIDGKTASRHVFERMLPKDMAYPAPGLTARWEGKRVMITTRNLARAVMLDFGAIAAQPSDDGFDLMPGESVTIDVASDASASALARALTLRTLSAQP
jgi:beta-mannosidase